MLEIMETWVNSTQGHIVGNTEFYKPYTDNMKRLFRSLQREYGRCISKMYIDILEQPERIRKTQSIGYVFQKKVKYTDCKDYYLQETWIEFRGIDLY